MNPVMSLVCVFTAFLCVVSVYSLTDRELQEMKKEFALKMSLNVPIGYFVSRKSGTTSQIPVVRSSSVFNVTNNEDPMVGKTLSLFDVSKDLKPEEIVKASNGSSVNADPEFGGFITSYRVKLIKYADRWSRDKVFPPKTLDCDVSVLTAPYHAQTMLSYACTGFSEEVEAGLWFANQVSERKKEAYNLYSLQNKSRLQKAGNSTLISLSQVILKVTDSLVDFIECKSVEIVRDNTKADKENAYEIKSEACR